MGSCCSSEPQPEVVLQPILLTPQPGETDHTFVPLANSIAEQDSDPCIGSRRSLVAQSSDPAKHSPIVEGDASGPQDVFPQQSNNNSDLDMTPLSMEFDDPLSGGPLFNNTRFATQPPSAVRRRPNPFGPATPSSFPYPKSARTSTSMTGGFGSPILDGGVRRETLVDSLQALALEDTGGATVYQSGESMAPNPAPVATHHVLLPAVTERSSHESAVDAVWFVECRSAPSLKSDQHQAEVGTHTLVQSSLWSSMSNSESASTRQASDAAPWRLPQFRDTMTRR